MKSNNTIFIFSQHRTGSTLLKNILDANSDIAMAFDEMNLFEPFRKNTLNKVIKTKGMTGSRLVNLIKKKKIYGTFWKEFDKSNIDYEELAIYFDSIQGKKLEPFLIYILDKIRISNNTKFSGVKYPTHFRKMNFIFNTFKNSKNIFITRHPLAIIASKINDPATRKRIKRLGIFGFLIRYITFFYFILDYISSYFIYKKYRNNLKIIFYEDLVLNKYITINNICDFLSVEFNKEMLKATGKLSSYSKIKKYGLYESSLVKYKSILKPLEIKILVLLTKRYYNRFLNELLVNI